MGLELAYWVALGVGAGFLVLSILLGDVLDVFDFDIGDGVSATPILFTAIAAFGGGGLLALKAAEVSQGKSVLVGLASSLVLGGLALGFFRVLGKQEAEGAFSATHLVGLEGRCTVAIPPGKTGRVSVHHQGMTRSFTATSEQEIGSGDEIVVREALGNSLKVSRR
jgi:membrane protein implicated in regulation of membrane protease activity